MAKKKKSKSKKKVEAVSEPRGSFWPLAGAILLFVLSLFMLLGGFGTGGPLPVKLFSGAYAAFGWAAYLVPLALIYWGAYKFMTEDHKMPLGKMTAMILILAFSAGFFFTAFAAKQSDGTFVDGYGGWVGSVVGTAILTALDKIPASIILFVLAVMSVFWAFSISPKVFLSFWRLFRTKTEDDTDLEDLSTKEGFKLHAGVPVEYPSGSVAAKAQPRMSTLKNSAPKLTPAETHEALTSPSDPNWQLPPITLLNQKQDKANAGDINGNAEIIKHSFANFNIDVEMEGANVGPRVTQYTLKPPTGVKLTKITALENNLALDLAAHSIRMEAPIPGKRAVGIEVPNVKAATVRVSSLLQDDAITKEGKPLSFVIGRDIAGKAIVADLAKMPHLLVAGQTGSGKSVMINTILASLLYRNSPADLKLILVDPKFVELGTYNNLPHLLTPVITEPEKCISALKWAVAEMERRLRAMADVNASNIIEYNDIKKEAGMPYIVIIIDELSDLMMMAARDVEALIVRLAQKARAAGIHLVLATQRPSVNVITGLIKANVPARIAFTVNSQVDSRTIIDGAGAEKLLGMGDMLFVTADMPKPKRVQGALIEKSEVIKVTDFIKQQREPDYNVEVVSQPVQLNGKGGIVADMGNNGGDADEDMWRDAVHVVLESRKASTSLLQRKLRIGYGRAARIMETMEEQGIIGQADGSRPRDVLVSSMDEVFGGAGNSEIDDEVSNRDSYLAQ
jgi:DNA segregation ATPase FtsK/SpoIIIE, S-DNA-T family